jgi:hypothetical protein
VVSSTLETYCRHCRGEFSRNVWYWRLAGDQADKLHVQLTVGGIDQKPGIVNGEIEPCEYLSLTATFDHDVVDGVPATRFLQRLKELIEEPEALT